ncbi:MAG: DUF445 domain-containing protein [Pseudomonadota bacterium]
MVATDSLPFEIDAGDTARAAQLRRIKALATAALGGCLLLLVIARSLRDRHPAFGFIAAFAEAATIGGLADWYAVVALFRRPLGLPIPHTAIIQTNQQRIADKLGEFIEVHFLRDDAVDAKLQQTDFARFVAEWLDDRKRSGDLARFLLHLLPEALSAVNNSGLKTFFTRRILGQIQALDLAPLAAGTLRGFIRDGRHQALLDDLLVAVHGALNNQETLTAIRDKIRAELPTLLKLYRAEKYVLNKVVASATSFFEDVRNDPQHPFRGEFDRMVRSFVDRLETDPAYAERIEQLKRDVLARPELGELAQHLWSNVLAMFGEEQGHTASLLEHHLSRVFREAGRQLAVDADMRAEINQGLVVVLRSFIAAQKSGVSSFIADQVKSWDMRQLIGVIELNVGHDLQYIRFNGMLIGGLAGLALHTAEYLIRLL